MTLSCSHIVVYRRVSIVLPFIHSLVHVSQNKFNKMSNPEMAFGDLDGANFVVIFLHFFVHVIGVKRKPNLFLFL